MTTEFSKSESNYGTKVGDYYLPQKVIERMRQNLKLTDKIGVEHGFSLCMKAFGKKPEIYSSKQCIGKACELELKKGCKYGYVKVGHYHTHATGDTKMSLGDIHNKCQQFNAISCVGAEDKINCYTFKDIPEEKIASELKHCTKQSEIEGKLYEDKLDDIDTEIHKILNSDLDYNKKMEEYEKLEYMRNVIRKRYDNRTNRLMSKYFNETNIK